MPVLDLNTAVLKSSQKLVVLAPTRLRATRLRATRLRAMEESDDLLCCGGYIF
jgi:hypothetical protein